MKYDAMIKTTGALATATVLLTACGSDSDSGSNDPLANKPYTVVDLPTGSASNPEWAYFDFATGEVVDKNAQWDIAFRRLEVKVNDHVKEAIRDEQEDFYLGGEPLIEKFQNDKNLELEEPAFYGITTVNEEDFTPIGLKPAIALNELVSYNFIPEEQGPGLHFYTANTENDYILMSSAGDTFARMKAVSVVPQTFKVTFEINFQGMDDTEFKDAANILEIDYGLPGITCYDFDTDTATTVSLAESCSEEGWDISFVASGRDNRIQLNGGASGDGRAMAVGPNPADLYTSGGGGPVETTVPGWSYETDIEGNALAHYAPFEYFEQQVYPNYRTYVLDLGEGREMVKFQLFSYYGKNRTGDSGTVSMRYMNLTDNGE